MRFSTAAILELAPPVRETGDAEARARSEVLPVPPETVRENEEHPILSASTLSSTLSGRGRPRTDAGMRRRREIMAIFADGRRARSSEIADAMGAVSEEDRQLIYSTIGNLKDRGQLVRIERGLYEIVDAHAVIESRPPPSRPPPPRTPPPPAPETKKSSRNTIPMLSRRTRREVDAPDPNTNQDWPLVDAFQAGDRSAGDVLLRRHEGMLRNLAARYYGVDYEDVLQVARMGFLHGLKKSRRDEGATPLTYSMLWARSAIGRFVEDNASDVRVPNWLHQSKRARSRMRLNASDDGQRLLYQVSIDEPCFGGEGEKYTLGDLLEAPSRKIDDDDVSREAAASSEISDVLELLEEMPSKERDVLRRRFGIGVEQQTLYQIGAIYDVSRERVRQIETQALRRLRAKVARRIAEERRQK